MTDRPTRVVNKFQVTDAYTEVSCHVYTVVFYLFNDFSLLFIQQKE